MDERDLKPGYVPALDGIRGVAIICVMIMHSGFKLFKGGFIGVDIFFVLSGFLITYLLVREYDSHEQRFNLKAFYARRALRLGPALILLLIGNSLWGIFFFTPDDSMSNLVDGLITLFYMTNWARAFDIHPPHFLGHTWSLSIEEQFYIIWPITLLMLLRLIRSRANLAAVISVGALAACLLRLHMALNGVSYDRMYNGLDTRADSLLIGCAVGVLIASDVLSAGQRRRIASLLAYLPYALVAALLYIGYFARWPGIETYIWVLPAVASLTALLVLYLFVVPESRTRRFLSYKPLVWIGSISYGLYLWHYPVYAAIKSFGFTVKTVLVGGGALTFLIAIASYYWVERPALKFKNSIR